MTIQELKQQILDGTISDAPIIFKDQENGFVSNQYINEISKVRNLEINYVHDLNEVLTDSRSIFSVAVEETAPSLNVLKSDVYIWGPTRFDKIKNLIVVVSKFQDKEVEAALSEYIVAVPKLEEWQIKDYIFSIAEGVPEKDLEWLINLCGNNKERLQLEIDKVTLFGVDERKYLFNDLIRDGAVDDLSSYNIFSFSNALMEKNLPTLLSIYRELDRVDINEFGLLTILLKNFKNLMLVQLSPNPTPETTGLEAKQLYAIKRIPRVYTGQQLVEIFNLLSDMDRRVKMGEFPTEIMIDYLMIKILSM